MSLGLHYQYSQLFLNLGMVPCGVTRNKNTCLVTEKTKKGCRRLIGSPYSFPQSSRYTISCTWCFTSMQILFLQMPPFVVMVKTSSSEPKITVVEIEEVHQQDLPDSNQALLSCQIDEKGEIALTRMRKAVQKLGGSTGRYEDPTLLRFLNARSMDAEKAAKMFVQWQTWRASFVPNGFIPDSQIPDELEARKAYLQDLSKDGYPVLILKVSSHLPGKDHLQCKRFVVYMMDKAIARYYTSSKSEWTWERKRRWFGKITSIFFTNIGPKIATVNKYIVHDVSAQSESAKLEMRRSLSLLI